MASNAPHIGFLYPAGGQQGSTFEAMIGGQRFEGATNVFVSGEGVSVEILRYTVKYDPKELRQLFRNKENTLATRNEKAEKGENVGSMDARIAQIDRRLAIAELPEGVDFSNPKKVFQLYKEDAKEQFNPQISDRLRIRVRVAKNAVPGERELRVYTPKGLSNPFYFEVGALPESQEVEPNDDHMSPGLLEVPVPSVINGQVRPGDIDHFRFKAGKGDSVVVDVSARRIIPYLADAVPGWFQAVVAIHDEDGNEVAYQDDYKFNPDPVLFFDVPAAGSYTLSIRDSIYRGREDFIYRIAIGELPFITSIFPLGAQQGREVDIALSGRNLPTTRLTGTLPNNGREERHVSVKKEGYRSNQMPFAIGSLPETLEAEPNDAAENAQPATLPLVVNGRIQLPGDRDVFSFQGKKGESVSIETTARRLNSPIDTVITLTGPGLEKPVRNDDHMPKDASHLHLGAGLVTHHADSYLLHDLPATGTYFVEIGDAQSQGGHDYAYRLRISQANPDFKLWLEPSGIQIAPGGTAMFSVRALRLDGFDGRINLKASTLPKGFEMSEAAILPGSDTTRFTITAPAEMVGKVVSPEIVGVGQIAGGGVTHPAIPVDDQMQAFLYRHLVPAQELVLAPVATPSSLEFVAAIPKSGVIELPLGQEVRVVLDGQIRAALNGAVVRVDAPPPGISSDKGWVGRKKTKEKKADGSPKFDKNLATGSIMLKADEPLKPGDRFSLVLVASVKRGQEDVLYPAPAIPVKVVRPRGN